MLKLTAAALLPALLAISPALAAEDASPAPVQGGASGSEVAMVPDPAAGWMDMLRRRREVSRNTVAGIKRHAHDGDYAFIRGQFVKKMSDTAYIFTDGKDRLEVRFDQGKVPSDFTLNADYMVWGQMHRENVIVTYMHALLLSPRRLPPHDGVQYQGMPPCEGRDCQHFPRPGEESPAERGPYPEGQGESVSGDGGSGSAKAPASGAKSN